MGGCSDPGWRWWRRRQVVEAQAGEVVGAGYILKGGGEGWLSVLEGMGRSQEFGFKHVEFEIAFGHPGGNVRQAVGHTGL